MEYPDHSSGIRELTSEETIQSTKTIDRFDYIYGNITKTNKKTDLEKLTKSLQRILELQEIEENNINKVMVKSEDDGGKTVNLAPIKKKHRKKADVLKLPDLIKG
jgi:hypothetical protein